MSAPPPVQQQQAQPSTSTATAQATSGVGVVWGIIILLPIVFLFMFHLGAGYLSYQKYGQIGWAILDFFFAYFYYPYYAFFLSGCPVEQSILPSLMGGVRRMFKGGRKH